MQDRPEVGQIIAAIGKLIAEDIRPRLDDPALSFRALIASNLCRIAATELAFEEDHDRKQLDGLRGFLGVETTGLPPRRERHAEIRRHTEEVARRIRAEELSDAERARLWKLVEQTLVDRLSVTNPRFEIAQRIE